MDEDGYLFINDRAKDMIISGGVNIYPAEVEGVLSEHSAVGDVAVIGIPDSEWGEQVKAVVELVDGVAPSDELAAELVAFLSGARGPVQVPSQASTSGHGLAAPTVASSTSAFCGTSTGPLPSATL